MLFSASFIIKLGYWLSFISAVLLFSGAATANSSSLRRAYFGYAVKAFIISVVFLFIDIYLSPAQPGAFTDFLFKTPAYKGYFPRGGSK